MALLDAAAATYEQIGHPRRGGGVARARVAAGGAAAVRPPRRRPHALEGEVQLDQASQQLGNALKLCERARRRGCRATSRSRSAAARARGGGDQGGDGVRWLRSAALRRKVAAAALRGDVSRRRRRDDSAVAAFLFVEKGPRRRCRQRSAH